MSTNGFCKHCGKNIRFGISLCEKCNDIKRNNLAMVCQNKKKLKKILEEKNFTPEWFDKFILYANNIIHYGKVLIEFKEIETIRTFNKIKKIGTIGLGLFMIMFFGYKLIFATNNVFY